MNEKNIFFVQFIHPGKENKPDEDNYKCWNTEEHKRKFLRQGGVYLNKEDEKVEGDIMFWGEWEPQSIAKLIDNPKSDYEKPHYLYEPFYNLKEISNKLRNINKITSCRLSKGNSLQNTDPFVFGDRFFYGFCRQDSKPSLHKLEVGSVIIFGSCKNEKFIIDTVFVVDDYIDYNSEKLDELKTEYKYKIKDKIPETYKDVALNLFSKGNYRFYIGATYDKPYEGMFSYFPCQLYKEGTKGFKRPNIELKDKITQNMTWGIKLTSCNSIQEVKKLWKNVKKQITDQGLMLGIKAKMPIQQY
jgi:hypothetical protein